MFRHAIDLGDQGCPGDWGAGGFFGFDRCLAGWGGVGVRGGLIIFAVAGFVGGVLAAAFAWAVAALVLVLAFASLSFSVHPTILGDFEMPDGIAIYRGMAPMRPLPTFREAPGQEPRPEADMP